MNRAQRITCTLYFLLLALCLTWIPWKRHIPAAVDQWYATNDRRLGYGWIWAGPRDAGRESQYARPDMHVIYLRAVALTAIGAAAVLAIDAV